MYNEADEHRDRQSSCLVMRCEHMDNHVGFFITMNSAKTRLQNLRY